MAFETYGIIIENSSFDERGFEQVNPLEYYKTIEMYDKDYTIQTEIIKHYDGYQVYIYNMTDKKQSMFILESVMNDKLLYKQIGNYSISQTVNNNIKQWIKAILNYDTNTYQFDLTDYVETETTHIQLIKNNSTLLANKVGLSYEQTETYIHALIEKYNLSNNTTFRLTCIGQNNKILSDDILTVNDYLQMLEG